MPAISILLFHFSVKSDRLLDPNFNENINVMPGPLRRYIHDLETVCDPADDVRELFMLKTENKMLQPECERLAVEKNSRTRFRI